MKEGRTDKNCWTEVFNCKGRTDKTVGLRYLIVKEGRIKLLD